APAIAHLLGNDALSSYVPYVGIYLCLTIMSAVLEIVMTSRKRFFATASAYAVSEVLRGAAFILPALLIGRLEWLLIGAIIFAALRLAGTLFYLFREFGALLPQASALKKQLAYALPLAASSLLADWGWQFHQYAVSHYFDAATFAVYAVGCLNIPLVELVHSPVGNVLMVRMGEELRDGRREALLATWNDTTRKLALIFFPMFGLLIVTARELIVFLFTANYLASVPIFMIWSATVLLPVLQTDAVLRVYAQTRFLLWISAAKLLATVALIYLFITYFELWGAALVTVLVSFGVKIASLAQFKRLAKIPLPLLLPWKSLAVTLAAGVAAGALTTLIKSHLEFSPLPLLFVAGLSYGAAYLALAFALGVITDEERQALLGSLQRIPLNAAKVGQIIKSL
ncbi:MAG TPA: oligosaccharide flippase family protein, partial [Candidatus Binatia bacterium]